MEWNFSQIIAEKFSPALLTKARHEILEIKIFMNKNNRLRPSIDEYSCDIFTVGAIILETEKLSYKSSETHKNSQELAIFDLFIESRL